jgi:hypothetical protein
MSHPRHDVPIGPDAPDVFSALIETKKRRRKES